MPVETSQNVVQTLACAENISQLLGSVDGIVIQRGTLGLHTPAQHTARLQKKLLRHCNVRGKPVLLTDVIDSMQVRFKFEHNLNIDTI
ncbi:MAG: hypothetical protein HC767_14865 [Akkermansiaceae bacterium]|nr:hypothetical protein [Akkermansiaceae bacterium]